MLLSLTYFRKIIFLYIQEKECATFLIAPTIESYLGTLQKHQELASSGYPYFFFFNLLLLLFFFFGVLESFVFFYIFDYVILGSYDNGPKTFHTENLYPSQAYLISERGQKILYWKLGQSCCFIFFSIFIFILFFLLPFSGYSQQLVLCTHPLSRNIFLLLFLGFLGVFGTFDDVISRY